MATEKFFAFNESGTLKRLKGRILRYLDSEDPDNDDKVAIRASLSVPGSAEGLTPANNLSDVSDVATSRDNLSVPSVSEFNQGIGTRDCGGMLSLDGSNDYLEVADSDILSPSNGTTIPPHTLAGWVGSDDITNLVLAARYGTTTATREFLAWINAANKPEYILRDVAGQECKATADSAVTANENKGLFHLAFVFAGSGGGYPTTLITSGNAITIYFNGKPIAATATNSGTFAGVSNTTAALWVGRANTSYSKGLFKSLRYINRALSAQEVIDVMNGVIRPIDMWGGAVGGVYSSDFSAGVDGWTATTNGATVGNVDSIGGQNDCLEFTVNTTNGAHSFAKSGVTTAGVRYRVSFDYYIPTQSNVDGFTFGGDATEVETVAVATLDAWTRDVFEYTADSTALRIKAEDGGVETFADAGGDDKIYIRNLKVTKLGVIADIRADDYNPSAGKILDRSSNNLVAVNNGATHIGARRHLSASTINLSGLPTSSAGLSAGEVWNNSGVLTIV